MSNISRKQMEADNTEVFQIDSPTTAFLVKNYTGGPAFVCAGTQYSEEDSIMVAANIAEVVQLGVFMNALSVHTSNAGIVEVGRFDGRQIFPLTSGGAQGQGLEVPDDSVASDSEFDDMLSEIFGSAPDDGTP